MLRAMKLVGPVIVVHPYTHTDQVYFDTNSRKKYK